MSRLDVRLKERDEARKAAIAARRLEKEEKSKPEETASYFREKFTSQKAAIEGHLAEAMEIPQEKLLTHFNFISEECHALQRLVSDATIYLPVFKLKTAQKQIAHLQTLVSTTQDQLLPPPKFAFRSRQKNVPLPEFAGPPASIAPPPPKRKPDEKLFGFRAVENQTLSLPSTEIGSHDVNLSHLKGCEVRLFGTPMTLHMTNLEECCVLCGPVSSSVFVENCHNCTFVVACQQLRIHTTLSSVFYHHVTSKAIIEDCSQLQFTPYNLHYPNLAAHFKVAGLSEDTNNWDKVDDFDWLASDQPSPNWALLPWEQRKEWNYPCETE